MILHVNPASSIWVRGAAEALLIAHISAGGAGLISGATALLSSKGARLHRAAGNMFFVSMLIMTGIGGCVAPLLPQRASVVPAIFTFYLVVSGWATVRRRDGGLSRIEIGALGIALCGVVIGVLFGLQAARSSTGSLDGGAPADFYGFAAFTAIAAALDMKVWLRRANVGAKRVARHLWRMGAALLIAALSFFIGQPKVFPAPLHGSPVLFAPPLAVLALTIFWLARVHFPRRAGVIPAPS
jgi:hypothetical protein